MKIGLDAKWLYRGPGSGRVVLRNIVENLIRLYPDHEWHIFLDKIDAGLEFPFKGSNIHLYYVWARYNMLSNLFVLPSMAARLDLDVVLFQTFSPADKRFRSIAFIHDVLFRDYPQFFTWKEKLYFTPLRWVAPSAHRIITTTQIVKNKLLEFKYFTNSEKIDIAPLGINRGYKPLKEHDPQFVLRVMKKYKLPDSYLLFVGRLNVRKNIENLIKSLPLLFNKIIPLVVVGKEDWKSPRFQHLLHIEEIRNRVLLTGEVDDEELKVIYAKAKIFCFPSFAEGFGLPPLEAMASGIPVIVSDTSSMPEVCGSAGYYVNPFSPENIADAINELLENCTLYEKKILFGLERAKLYTWEKTVQEIMKSFERI